MTANGICLRWLPAGAFARQIAHKLTRTVCRVSDLKSAEHKKSSSEATWIFCMEPNCFGVKRGVQPLFHGSSALKSLVVFWFSFATKREHSRRRYFLQKAENVKHTTTLCTGSKWLKSVLLVIINKPVIVFFVLE